jgi:hypothetical protein
VHLWDWRIYYAEDHSSERGEPAVTWKLQPVCTSLTFVPGLHKTQGAMPLLLKHGWEAVLAVLEIKLRGG